MTRATSVFLQSSTRGAVSDRNHGWRSNHRPRDYARPNRDRSQSPHRGFGAAGVTQVNAETVHADLCDWDSVVRATVEADTIIHLAEKTEECEFPEVLRHNVTGTYNVLEAARMNGVARVVLASSHHVVGFYPVGQPAWP